MNIVVPLAGKDARFERLNIPKPFVEVENKPLIKFCIDSLEYPFKSRDYNLYFLILREHNAKYNLRNKLKNLFSNVPIITLEKLTEGAACTVLTLEKEIDNEEELIVYLADIYFSAPLEEKIELQNNKDVAGFIPVFNSDNPKYSYAKTDSKGFVIEVAEKKVISKNASSGFYYFRKGRYFVDGAKRMIRNNDRVNNLFYICPVYNYMIKSGLQVKIIESKFIFDLGDDRFIRKYIGKKGVKQ